MLDLRQVYRAEAHVVLAVRCYRGGEVGRGVKDRLAFPGSSVLTHELREDLALLFIAHHAGARHESGWLELIQNFLELVLSF